MRLAVPATLLVVTALLAGCAISKPSPEITPQPSASGEAAGGTDTLIGWSGTAIPGVEQEVFGTWMARDSWDGMSKGQWLEANKGFVSYVAEHPDGAADIGVPLIPHDSGEDLNDLLDEAVSGDHDEDYRSLGAWLATHGPKTTFARLYWEMNMSPVPADSIDRAKFKAAWDHAVPLLREGFAAAAPDKQLSIVFCPLTDGADYHAFYPSDENVDVIAIDAYSQIWSSSTPSKKALIDSVDGYLTEIADFAKEKGKPVALGEWANWHAGEGAVGKVGGKGLGDFPEYIDQVFDWAQKNDALYLVYYNIADDTLQKLSDTPKSLEVLQRRAQSLQR